jgi:hypothetical protein
MNTQSENIVTEISSNVFYKEFTFNKNDFYPIDGKKELADNVLWLDDLLFIIQVKERNPDKVRSEKEENKWFENAVLRTAKKQIRDSISFFDKYNEIKIRNVRNHQIDISQASKADINKLIIYKPNSSLISERNKCIKFYASQQSGNIHILNIDDYSWVCRFLITPAELDEYLKFRERIYLRHKKIVTDYPEQYILAHFLNTDDETIIQEKYIETLDKLVNDTAEFDVSSILNNFLEKINIDEQKNSVDYYKIIKEIAKLKRYELIEFKKRFTQMIEDVKSQTFSLPYRFTITRTGCGFVFVPLLDDKAKFWKNAILNFTELYKYKRNLNKCLGVLAFKTGEYFDIYWAYMESEWQYNENLQEAVKHSDEFYNSEIQQVDRYRFQNDS